MSLNRGLIRNQMLGCLSLIVLRVCAIGHFGSLQEKRKRPQFKESWRQILLFSSRQALHPAPPLPLFMRGPRVAVSTLHELNLKTTFQAEVGAAMHCHLRADIDIFPRTIKSSIFFLVPYP
jgi:hypothetical protein